MNRDLDSGPADVRWRMSALYLSDDMPSEKRVFATLREAVRFVRDELSDSVRSTAHIETPMGELTIHEILYLALRL